MRHSNCGCTLEIYSQARIQAKRDAQHRVIQMIVPWKGAIEVQEPRFLAKTRLQCRTTDIRKCHFWLLTGT